MNTAAIDSECGHNRESDLVHRRNGRFDRTESGLHVRYVFSNTTIESSMIMPTEMVSASSVIVFIVKAHRQA